MSFETGNEIVSYVEMNCYNLEDIKLFGEEYVTTLIEAITSRKVEGGVGLNIDTRRARRTHNHNIDSTIVNNSTVVPSLNMIPNYSSSASSSNVKSSISDNDFETV